MDAHAQGRAHGGSSLSRLVTVATLHCLTGCAIGEVLGLVIGTALRLSNVATVVIAIVLAFFFGYTLTTLPLLRSGLALAVVVPLAFASDTISITVMEIVDNLVILIVPGAMDAGLADVLFWGALALSLGVAFVVAWPVNRYLIARGRGHAVVHGFHGGHGSHREPAKLNAGRLAVLGITAIALTVAIGVVGATLLG